MEVEVECCTIREAEVECSMIREVELECSRGGEIKLHVFLCVCLVKVATFLNFFNF